MIVTQRNNYPAETFAAKTWADDPVQSAAIDQIYDLPGSGWMPVGSVEFYRAAMSHQGIREPAPIDYPECLYGYLVDKPFLLAWGMVRHARKLHIKPWRTKLDRPEWQHDTIVWVMPKHRFAAEWRYYVCQGVILGRGRYDDGPDDAPEVDESRVAEMVDRYQQHGAPAGYGLDVGVSAEDRRTQLIEVNDGWALGLYKGTCSAKDYVRLLEARWAELSAPGG
ncbi:ATP-grasp domain-containing protein [Acidithiobacillus sp. M4-SHS-6]|uniref:ATP-grasp domain-containing protein n=1 Tax=Acidithiobacillus sp. M4-SHS-6 TaxID=3383024 RepID=UPI0039BE44E8